MAKRILIATDCFMPRIDGISVFLDKIIPGLSRDFDISVIAPGFQKRPKEIPGVSVSFIDVMGLSIGDFYPAKIRLGMIKKEVKQCDLVFSQTFGTIGLVTLRYARKFGKPVVAFTHSIEPELVSRSISKFKRTITLLTKIVIRGAYNRCDAIIVPSKRIAEKLVEIGIRTEKIIVPLGVDTDLFAPPESKEEAKERIGISSNTKVIGYVGRIAREKSLTTLYKAFRRVEKHHNNITLLIVGGGLRKEIFKDDRNIIFIDPTPDIVRYYQAMDIFVLPSLTETSSLSTMEAMSCGLAVITTKVGSLIEYIEHGPNGFFFPKEHYKLLATKIESLLMDDILRTSTGKAARKTIISNFDWKNTIDGIKRVLSKY